jgi:hypothetical protein
MKIFFTSILILILSQSLFSQVIKDRNVVTMGVTLTQILRLNIDQENGIGFEYDNYKVVVNINGNSGRNLNNQTKISVMSSVRWKILYGSETPYFIGMNNSSNTMDINNIGFELINVGLHSFGYEGELRSPPTNNATQVSALETYPTILIEDNDNRYANAGDDMDNSFIIKWRCGTSENGMNPISIINQNINPDTYYVNVLIELIAE